MTVEASECSELIVMSDIRFVFLLESQDDALRSLWDEHVSSAVTSPCAGVHAALAVSQQSWKVRRYQPV